MTTIDRETLDRAAAEGILSPDQAEKLWALAAERSGPGGASRFTVTTALYSLGGMLAVGAMALFLKLGWDRFGARGVLVISLGYLLLSLGLAARLQRRGLELPMALIATVGVALVPVVVWAAMRELGIPVGQRPIPLEVAAAIAAIAALARFRAPMLILPAAATAWLAGLELTVEFLPPHGGPGSPAHLLLQQRYSVVAGLLLLATAFHVDLRVRPRRDHAFWLYLTGLAAAWGGVTWMEAPSLAGTLLYLAGNAGLVLIGAVLARRVFAVFGAAGVAIALGTLGDRYLRNSWLFPLAITLVGLALVAFGVWWSRNEARLSARLQARLPAGLREAIARRREARDPRAQ